MKIIRRRVYSPMYHIVNTRVGGGGTVVEEVDMVDIELKEVRVPSTVAV